MDLIRIDSKTYNKHPERYELVDGKTAGAPKCPYGNNYRWIGFDLENERFVRFTKSIFKKLIQTKDNDANQ